MVNTSSRTLSLTLAALLISAVGAVLFTPSGVSRRIKSVASDRLTVWKPGLNADGGIPHHTTICATVDASTYGNGARDAGPAIQVALDMCPDGQVGKSEADVLAKQADALRARSRHVCFSVCSTAKGTHPDFRRQRRRSTSSAEAF
jgi:hypothetical protein